MATNQAMLQEAINAVRSGDKERAKDLLTRLIRMDKDYADHWLWMSAVVETRQEKIFCLENLLRVDPESVVAKRGLALLGARPLTDVKPVAPKRREPWKVADIALQQPTGLRAILKNPTLRIIFFVGVGIFIFGMIGVGIVGVRALIPPTPTPDFLATADAVGGIVTLTPSLTPSPSLTPEIRTPTPTAGRPTPLSYYLDATYTPTPLYLETPHIAEAYRNGINAHRRGDWESVVLFMGQTVQTEPDSADAYYYLGEGYRFLEDYEKSLEAYNNSIGLEETFGPGYLGRALVLLALDPAADVEKEFQDAALFSPDFGDIYFARAAYWITRDQPTLAVEDLDFAELLLPESPQIPYLRGLLSYNQGEYSEALQFALEANQRDFTDLPTYLLLGKINFALGNYEDAIDNLKTYSQFNAQDTEAALYLVQALGATGDFGTALILIDEQYEQVGNTPEILYQRGMIYLEMGETDLALSDLNAANRLDRNNYNINLALGRALLDLEDPGDAYVQFTDTLALASTPAQSALVFYYRGLSLVMIGDPNSLIAAERDFASALENETELPVELATDAKLQLFELQNP